jgi:hypothetical protein
MSVPVLFLAVALASAGVPQQPSSTPPRPSSNASDDRLATLAPASAVVEGCVVTAREFKGEPSGAGERIGFNEHFVLTAAKVVKGRAPGVAGAAAGPATYRIDGFTDEQLTLHVGRRVHIDGTFGSIDRGAAPADPKHAELPELTATTIRQIPGDCAIPKS